MYNAAYIHGYTIKFLQAALRYFLKFESISGEL